ERGDDGKDRRAMMRRFRRWFALAKGGGLRRPPSRRARGAPCREWDGSGETGLVLLGPPPGTPQGPAAGLRRHRRRIRTPASFESRGIRRARTMIWLSLLLAASLAAPAAAQSALERPP